MSSPTSPSFLGMGIAPKLLEVLTQKGYTAPTPIQAQAIPIAIEGKDVMGIAQTGTGKTLAFGIPLLQQLAKKGGIGLILLPTRELAIQVEEAMQKLGQPLGLRSVVLIGGASIVNQIRDLKRNPHILIATPGRLNDHLDQKTVDLRQVSVLVLDEADRMLDMGFEPQIKRILQHVPGPDKRQTMLFSATMPPEITKMASAYMNLPLRIEIARAGTAASTVTQEAFIVSRDQKPQLLERLLQTYKGSILVFSRTKHGATKIARQLRMMDHTATEIHSNRSLAQRRAALDAFRSGRNRILVATDIAARGIDVQGIELVVNYDLPDHTEDYIHRIGRTGRAGREGVAVSFATPDQARDLRDIERLMRIALKVSPTPRDLPAVKAVPRIEFADDRPQHDGRTRTRRPFGARGFDQAAPSAYGARPQRSGYGSSPSSSPSSDGPRRAPSSGGRPSFGGAARRTSAGGPPRRFGR